MQIDEPPSYITLDIEIVSKEDLAALKNYLEEKTFILGLNKVDDLFYLSFEPNYDEKGSPETSANLIINVLLELPSELKKQWHNSESRTFDFGFDSGTIAPSYNLSISPSTLKKIAELEASITITIYQHRPLQDETEST